MPSQARGYVSLFLEDPLFSIPTNQWRNIAAHKSFTINTDNIVVEYGRGNIQSKTISYSDFYKIVQWTQDIYRVIRLAQVLTDLNYIREIVEILDGTENMNIRFEASLLRIIHNMQIVGFKFVSNEEQNETFCLNVKGKVNYDVKSSLIHASQCLDQLSRAIYNDKFVRDTFQKTKINIVDDSGNILASATISIETALKRAQGGLTVKEYLNKMEFDIKITARNTTAHCFKQWAVSLIDDKFTVLDCQVTLIVIFQHLDNIAFTKRIFRSSLIKGINPSSLYCCNVRLLMCSIWQTCSPER